MKHTLLLLGLVLIAPATWSDDMTLTPLTREQLDTSQLSPRGKQLLDDPLFKWQHARTPHFILHFEQQIFAAKVARQAEFYYTYISSDLEGARDQIEGPGHIFIIREEKDWAHFIRTYQINTEWAASLVEGHTLYLQQLGTKEQSVEILGHEMTHLVINRFLTGGRLPLWLNEGLAEWYGELAYAAFKGIKKSKRQAFRNIKTTVPLDTLFHATTYPQDTEDVRLFYETSKSLTGFLLLNHPPTTFFAFLNDMATGQDVEIALRLHFGYGSVKDLEEAFQKFIR